MDALVLTLHVTAAAIVVGVLSVQSLAVVMALRLPAGAQRYGVRVLLGRVQSYVYYPVLALTLVTGLWIVLGDESFTQESWLRWKLLLVVLLAGLGLLTGQGIRAQRPLRALALAVHIAVIVVSGAIIYLAVLQPT
ncbi:MAG TPA: hypothetical protein VKB51_03360 [bacterium]|nr:hypothetical protein [bacterium]